MGFAKTRHGMQDIDMKRKWDVRFLQKGAGMQDQDPPPFQTLLIGRNWEKSTIIDYYRNTK